MKKMIMTLAVAAFLAPAASFANSPAPTNEPTKPAEKKKEEKK